MTSSPPPPGQRSRWVRRAVRYGLPVFFPVAVASATAVAAVNEGSIKAFWAVTAIVATAASAVFTVLKERQARAASRAASVARAQLAAGLNRAGAPLLMGLGNVTTAKTPEDLQAAIEVLTARVVDIAHSQCGRHLRPGANLRSVYYAYVEDRLERRYWNGRQGNGTPRRQFRKGVSLHDTEVIRFVGTEEVLRVDDLYYHAPPHFNDAKGRPYRSFISVPVRAGESSFGMLSLDSDLPATFTEVDTGHMILLAGVLAAGLAHQAHHTAGCPGKPPQSSGVDE
jgi:transcriptional regulator with GAF, ATPase, and Fis domain